MNKPDEYKQKRYLDIIEEEWDFKKNNKNGLYPDEIMHSKKSKDLFWKCCKCGRGWKTSFSNRTKDIKATGCPYCNRNSESFGESAIYFYLKRACQDNKHLTWVLRRRALLKDLGIPEASGKYESDIVLTAPEFKLVIEHNGVKHCDQDQKDIDLRKAKLLTDHNYELIRFYAYKKSEEELEAEYYYKESNFTQMQAAIEKFFIDRINKFLSNKVKIDVKEDCMKILAIYKPKKLYEKTLDDKTRFRRMELAAEWDYKKNAGFTIFNFSPNSNCYAHWVCRNCKHEWTSIISNRFRPNSGCPSEICQLSRGRKNREELLDPKDSFFQKCRDKAIVYWDYENNDADPDKISYTSTIEQNFICRKHNDYHWRSTPFRVSKLKFGCRKCGIELSREAKFKPVIQIDPKTSKIVNEFKSRKDLCKAGFRQVVRDAEHTSNYLNTNKTYKGYLWADKSESKASSSPTKLLEQNVKMGHQEDIIIINKITKEATYYADKISAKKDGVPNISNNIKRGKFRKNGEEYFMIDLKTERKKDSSLILDYYKL